MRQKTMDNEMDKRTELAINLGQTIYNNTINNLTKQRDDALDAMSRIMDVDAEPPFAAESLRELEPMAID